MSTGTSPRADQPPPQHGSSSHHEDPANLELEMRRIQERRAAMDEQGRRLVRRPESTPPTSARRSRSHVSASQSLVRHDPPGATHEQPIESEETRRRKLQRTSFVEMKNAMKDSWARDSTLVSGYFMTRSTGTGGSWGRAVRFSKPVGMKEQYYLANDVQRMQSREVRLDRRRFQVATRGTVGTNVNSRWNDSTGGTAPGPGAYTPRFAAASAGPRI
jgi:hypothetical protein